MTDHTTEPQGQDDYESTLRLLSDLQSLIRLEHIPAETRLRMVDEALAEAVGGSPERARDFVLDAGLGLLE